MMRPARTVTLLLLGALLAIAASVPPTQSDFPGNVTAAGAAGERKPAEEGPPRAADGHGKRAGKHGHAKLYDSGYMEDNQSCMVCHLDFEEEKISAVHLKKGITCAGCHGDSEAHRGDEWNIIRPDVIWGRAEMGPFCKQCHKKHPHGEKYQAFLEKWLDKRRSTGRWVTRESVCLDCHGNHAIAIPEGQFK